MVIREYKWEDLEELRKFFKMSLTELAEKLKTSRQTLYSAMHLKFRENPEETSAFWAMHVGMAWEIFAIDMADRNGITSTLDACKCYDLLLKYVREMNNQPKNKKVDFYKWYWEDYR